MTRAELNAAMAALALFFASGLAIGRAILPPPPAYVVVAPADYDVPRPAGRPL